jgi:hypothetical protein
MSLGTRSAASAVMAATLGFLTVSPCAAAVTVYTTQSAFSAATAVSNIATLDGVPTGRLGGLVYAQGGIQFTSIAGGHPTHTLYIVPAASTLVTPLPSTSVLSGDGDENFDIRLTSGNSFGSIGFDVYSNVYGPRTVSLFDTIGGLIGTYSANQAANSLGFIGLVSTTAIGHITTSVDRGWVQNTAIDNVQIGALAIAGAVPESSTWGMMIVGFGLVGASFRYRRRATKVRFA